MKNKLKTVALALISAITLSFGDVVFYGATRIDLPTNINSINVRTQAQYRIFAHDSKYGDISEQIEIVSGADANGTVNTIPTTVKYKVGNTEKDVQIRREGSNVVIERTIYTLSESDRAARMGPWVAAWRGDRHDAQHLGLYMPPNSTLRIKRGGFQDIIVRMTNWENNNRIDHNLSGESGWVSLQNMNNDNNNTDKSGIPFIITPYVNNSVSPTVEVEITDNVRELNYFHRGDNSEAFRNAWSSNSNVLGLIGNRSVQIILHTNHRGSGGDFNNILDVYAGIVDHWDAFIGFDINESNPTHKLVRTKTLIKPFHETAGAFYEWRAFIGMANNPNGSQFNSQVLTWPYANTQHEIAHGYDGTVGRSKELYLEESVTNLWTLAVIAAEGDDFDISRDSEPGRNRSRIFGTGVTVRSLSNNQRGARIGRLSSELGVQNSSPNLKTRNMLVTFYYADGHTIKDARRLSSAVYRNDREKNLLLGNLFVQSYLNTAKINIAPALGLYGFFSSDYLGIANAFENGRIAYPLDLLATDNDAAETVRAEEKLFLETSFIYPDASRDAQRGTGTARITVNNHSVAAGKKIYIRDGETIVATLPVSGTVDVPSLPIGAYHIDMPHAEGHYTGYNYLRIESGRQYNKTVSYTAASENFTPAAGVNYIELMSRFGFGGGNFKMSAAILYDPINKRITLQNPGHQGGNEAVGSVTIGSISTNIANNRTAPPSTQFVNNVNIDQMVVVDFGWSGGLSFVNSITGERTQTGITSGKTTFRVTRFGLMPDGLSETEQQEIYTANFFALANGIPQDMRLGMDRYTDLKTGLIIGSQLLSEADRETFNSDHKILYESEDPEPDPDPDPDPKPDPTPIRITNKTNKRILADNIVSDKAEIILEGTVNRFVVYDAIGNIVYDGVGKTWDLRNNAGREVAEGTYLLVVEMKNKDGKLSAYSARLGVKR